MALSLVSPSAQPDEHPAGRALQPAGWLAPSGLESPEAVGHRRGRPRPSGALAITLVPCHDWRPPRSALHASPASRPLAMDGMKEGKSVKVTSRVGRLKATCGSPLRTCPARNPVASCPQVAKSIACGQHEFLAQQPDSPEGRPELESSVSEHWSVGKTTCTFRGQRPPCHVPVGDRLGHMLRDGQSSGRSPCFNSTSPPLQTKSKGEAQGTQTAKQQGSPGEDNHQCALIRGKQHDPAQSQARGLRQRPG